MNITLYSDVHLEEAPWQPPNLTHSDVIVLAGDIAPAEQGIDWARQQFPDRPVIYVAGNHEFYQQEFHNTYQALTHSAKDPVRFLECGETVIGGVRFLGCTLWTGFDVLESPIRDDDPTGRLYRPKTPAQFGEIAQNSINDFHQIRVGGPRMSTAFMADYYQQSKHWLRQSLAQPFDGPTVVVTHFLPSIKCCPPQYIQSDWVPYFIANCEDLIREYQPELWLFGHSHSSMDFQIGGTRVVSNQKGYPNADDPNFDPNHCIRV